jgi:hypothetical protein
LADFSPPGPFVSALFDERSSGWPGDIKKSLASYPERFADLRLPGREVTLSPLKNLAR